MDRDARVQELLYSCDSREELCARITTLEEFAQDLYEFAELYDEEKGPRQWCEIRERMQALGIEVPK